MKDVYRLLLVGGELGQREATAAALREAGFDVASCAGASEALAAPPAHDCDLLVLLPGPPEPSRAVLARQAAALRPGPAVLVLGAAGPANADMTPPPAAIEYLPGPPASDELLAAVARVLRLRALRLENDRLAGELAESGRQLEALRAEFDRFAGRLAHDLQAVLQVSEGFAGALARTALPKLEPKERHYLERIAATSSRGNRLVHEVLAFARLGVHPIEPRPVALAQVLERAQRSVADQTEGRKVEWLVGKLPAVSGDAALLQQAFVHLLSHALWSTRERPTAVIRVEALTTAAGCEVRIGDNGIGFDPRAAERLFEPFECPDGAGGTGMGLALARRIVERHGGSIRAEAQPGRGALFAFTLPTPTGAERAPQPAAGAAPRGLRVLLVDDDPLVLLSLANMVEIDGHHVDSAAGGENGVEAFVRAQSQGQGYDAVITDLAMPHVDGREVARRIKQASPAAKVILLTGWGCGAAAAGNAPGEVDAILPKPPRLAQLRAALAGVRPA